MAEQITSAEALDALPVGSVVLNASRGIVAERISGDMAVVTGNATRFPWSDLWSPGSYLIVIRRPDALPAAVRPEVVVLCGSTRFREQIVATNRDLTLAGCIVLAPGVFGHSGDAMTGEQKEALDELHFRKIDMADRVVVVAPGGYIGSSTAREVTYAKERGKSVEVLTEFDAASAVPADPTGTYVVVISRAGGNTVTHYPGMRLPIPDDVDAIRAALLPVMGTLSDETQAVSVQLHSQRLDVGWLRDAPAAPVAEEPTAEEYREAYETWRAHGQAMHAVLLDLWRAVTPDSEHGTFGDDPDVVRSAVLAALAPAPVADDEREALIAGLRHDAGDYAQVARGTGPTDRILIWDQRDVRAWQAAEILSAPRTPASAATVEAAARVLYSVRDDPYDDTEWDDLTSADRERWICDAQALADAGMLRTPIPSALFDQALSDYRQAWHAADAAGREGERSREGLLAALTLVGVEVSDR